MVLFCSLGSLDWLLLIWIQELISLPTNIGIAEYWNFKANKMLIVLIGNWVLRVLWQLRVVLQPHCCPSSESKPTRFYGLWSQGFFKQIRDSLLVKSCHFYILKVKKIPFQKPPPKRAQLHVWACLSIGVLVWVFPKFVLTNPFLGFACWTLVGNMHSHTSRSRVGGN